MVSRISWALLWLGLTGGVTAQTQWDFSGYGVILPAYQRLNSSLAAVSPLNRSQQLNLTRLRLRPSLEWGSGSRLALEYELTSLYQSDVAFIQAEFDTVQRQLVDLHWTLDESRHHALRHFIDRLYFRQEFDWGHVAVGRQRIAWGSGRIWNPTDLFNPISPTNFAKIEKDGADLIVTKLYLGSFTDLTLVYNPQKSNRRDNLGFRFRSNTGGYDLSVMSGLFDDRFVAGGDFAGNLFKAGFRGEGIYSTPKDDLGDGFVRFILGLDYQFTAKLYTMVEYQHNGEGQSDPAAYDLLRLLRGEILNVGRSYLFFNSSYLLHPLLATAFAVNTNLHDRSGFFSATVTYSASDNVYLGLGLQLFWGDEITEYWYFPQSLYLKGEYYF